MAEAAPPAPGHCGWITPLETHAAAVLLLGDRAYKIKKPVDLGFLDFSSPAKRLAACQREVTLNRRLAPDVYLGVADILGPDGVPCDHLVVMRRMPAERRLSALVAAGVPLEDTIRRLARMVATFHTTAHRDDAVSAEGSRDAIRQRWQDSFDQLRNTAPEIIGAEEFAEIEHLTLEFLAGRDRLFAGRIADSRIVDGHGDLLTDDIFCLDDGPRILDCLEFNDQLRWLDGLDDAAFLAMDLERLGAPHLARQFLRDYAEFSGDPAPPSLRHHYVAYRAFVRAKVACLRHAQGDNTAATTARTYAELARKHLRAGQVRLILVGGLPGTGKSTLAAGLADTLGAVLLSADQLRKELNGYSPQDSASAAYGEGIYTPEHTARTYAELLHRAELLLARGESVIIDASWTNAAHRVGAAEVAQRTNSPLLSLRCHAPATVAATRMRQRHGSYSDADADIANHMAADAAPWPTAHTIITTTTAEDALSEALTYASGGIPSR